MRSTSEDERPLQGRDYPWLCPGCQLAVDQCGNVIVEGPDHDDPESACNLAYDMRLFCSEDGSRCANPPAAWVQKEIERYLRTGDVYECPACGKHSAYVWSLAENLGIPVVPPIRTLDDDLCAHCSTRRSATAQMPSEPQPSGCAERPERPSTPTRGTTSPCRVRECRRDPRLCTAPGGHG